MRHEIIVQQPNYINYYQCSVISSVRQLMDLTNECYFTSFYSDIGDLSIKSKEEFVWSLRNLHVTWSTMANIDQLFYLPAEEFSFFCKAVLLLINDNYMILSLKNFYISSYSVKLMCVLIAEGEVPVKFKYYEVIDLFELYTTT